MRRLATFMPLALLATSACSEEPGSMMADAASSGDGGALGPQIPWLAEGRPPVAPPAITPCPPGWSEVAGTKGDPNECEPWPGGAPLGCVSGLAQRPGEAACSPVGSPCPTGDFPEGLPTDRAVLYATPTASGGDGSQASPMSIGEALGAATPGTIVALAKGTYDTAVTLHDGVTLQGACAAETVLTTTTTSTSSGVVDVTAGHAELRDLRIANTPRIGILARRSGAELVVRGVVVEQAATAGIEATAGAVIDAADVVVMGGAAEHGSLVATSGATLTVARARIEASRGYAGYVEGATLRIEDSAVVRSFGIIAWPGGTARISRVAFEGVMAYALGAFEPGSSVEVTGSIIRDTIAARSGEIFGAGYGAVASNGGRITLSRTVVSRSHGGGVVANGGRSLVRAEDSVIRWTERTSGGGNGEGAVARSGARVELARAVLAGNHDDGVIAYGGAVRLDDVVVRDTFGDKLENAWGYGIAAYMGGTLEGARVIVQRAHNTGAVALEGTTMSLEDLLVQDTAPDPYDNLYGRGVGVNGAQLTLRRALIERSFELGVAAFEGATIATLEDIVVRDTMPRACATTTCAEAPAGTGLGAYLSASMSVRRFQVTRSSLCGVQVATSGGLDLSEGEVSMAAIGACVQIDGYLTTRLTDRVVYRDNGASIQGTALPVPEAGGSLPPL